MKKWKKTIFDVEFEKAKAGILAERRITERDEVKKKAKRKAQRKYGVTKKQKAKQTAKKVGRGLSGLSKWAEKNIASQEEMSKRLKKL